MSCPQAFMLESSTVFWNWETWFREASTRTVAFVVGTAIIAGAGLVWSFLVKGPPLLQGVLIGALGVSLLALLLLAAFRRRRNKSQPQIPPASHPKAKEAFPTIDSGGVAATPAELSALLQ